MPPLYVYQCAHHPASWACTRARCTHAHTHARTHARTHAPARAPLQLCMDPTLRAFQIRTRRAPEQKAASLLRQLIEVQYDEALSSAGGLLWSALGVSVQDAGQGRETHAQGVFDVSIRRAAVHAVVREVVRIEGGLPPLARPRARAPADTRHTSALTGLRVSHRVMRRALRFAMITQLHLSALFRLLAVRLHFASAACRRCHRLLNSVCLDRRAARVSAARAGRVRGSSRPVRPSAVSVCEP